MIFEIVERSGIAGLSLSTTHLGESTKSLYYYKSNSSKAFIKVHILFTMARFCLWMRLLLCIFANPAHKIWIT